MRLNLSRPRDITFIVAVVIAALTLLGRVTLLPFFTVYGYGLLLIAFIILALGVLVRDL